RERLPVLPALVSWVETERARTAELLAAAERSQPGDLCTTASQTLRRAVMKTETTGRIWAEHPDGGRRRNLTFEEHRGFWTWAMVEVLRHTGVRIEELTELSHHSLIQYRLPDTSELIPLLQIAPSKTDAERLLGISPELADVLSAIIARIRAGQPHVPLVVSYDKNERVYNSPMPLLFQWRRRLENRAVTETSLRSYLDHALTALGIKDAGGHPMRYTFHDFRRLFITDAIMHGMPPHIAAQTRHDVAPYAGQHSPRPLHFKIISSSEKISVTLRIWQICCEWVGSHRHGSPRRAPGSWCGTGRSPQAARPGGRIIVLRGVSEDGETGGLTTDSAPDATWSPGPRRSAHRPPGTRRGRDGRSPSFPGSA
nr:tyrosine-type recombinase/integrase [Actinomycetota bacterium]